MSFTLGGCVSGKTFHFTSGDWSETLDLAVSHGWRPLGTVLEDRPDWNGDYFSNDYQQLTALDVLRLSAALSRWLRKPSQNPRRKAYLTAFVKFARQSGGFWLS